MILLHYKTNPADWAPFFNSVARSIGNWAEPLETPRSDEHGRIQHFQVKRDTTESDFPARRFAVRCETLHIGANSILQAPHLYLPNHRDLVVNIWEAVANERALHDSEIGTDELNLLVQVAVYRRVRYLI